MPNTKYILEKIKLENEIHDLLVKSNAENVAVTWKEQQTTLAAALADIFTSLTNLPTADGVDSKISAAIGELVNGAPETGDTLKELFDLIADNEDAMALLNSAIGDKASAADLEAIAAQIAAMEGSSHSHDNKDVLDGITAENVSDWNGKADKTVATASANGLMSKEDKAKLDGLRGVRYGTEVPDDMQNGELFVRVVSAS